MSIIEQYKEWRKRRYWAKQHAEFLRVMLDEDWRWLVEDPVSRMMTDRYKKARSNLWYMLKHDSSEEFREKIRSVRALTEQPK